MWYEFGKLQGQILEIEAQVKVKNSDISDLESMVNNKVQSFKKMIWNNQRKQMEKYMKRRNQASTKNLFI